MIRPLLKLLLGAATVWPIVHFAVVLWDIPWVAADIVNRGDLDWAAVAPVAGHLTVATIWSVALTVWYVYSASRNPRLTRELKTFWILGFLAWGFVSMPLYWYRHVWRKTDQPPRRQDTSG